MGMNSIGVIRYLAEIAILHTFITQQWDRRSVTRNQVKQPMEPGQSGPLTFNQISLDPEMCFELLNRIIELQTPRMNLGTASIIIFS